MTQANNNLQSVEVSINIAKQTLQVKQAGHVRWSCLVSTAKNGIGAQQDSGCTPLGCHRICDKIGDNEPAGSVFVGRVATGERYNAKLAQAYPTRDWILTRILRLEGLQAGVNQGSNAAGGCDSYARYIYIHGTPATEPMGVPRSHGCVRLHDADLLALYDMVSVGTLVYIVAQ